MMYRCESYGHLFEEGEQAVWYERHGLDTPPYEQWDGCPICKGDFEEVHQCRKCDEWHTEDELYDGWCEKCLRETINYDSFFKYCEANKEHNYLDTFVMCYLLNCDEVPKYPSWDFHQLMTEEYQRTVRFVEYYKKVLNKKPCQDFLDKCIRFIMEDDGSIGRDDYADWLNKREVK